MRDKMKNIGIIFIILIFIFALSFFLYLNMKSFDIIDKKVIYAEVVLGDKYGFEINGSALKFGMIDNTASSTKTINLSNNYNENVKIEIYSKGKIKRFITVSENDFILEKNQVKTISFAVSFPENSEYGKYDGEVVVLIKRAG
jgi:hypothetical protein